MLKSVSVAFAASLFGILTAMPASALVPQANGSLQQQLRQQDQRITEIRARGGVCGSPDHGCRSARRCSKPHHRRARRCRGTTGISRRAARICRRLGAARLVQVAGGRRDRRRCGAGFRDGGSGSVVCRSSTFSRHVLVLHRSRPDAGVLGHLPVIDNVWSLVRSLRHDALAAARHRAERSAFGGSPDR